MMRATSPTSSISMAVFVSSVKYRTPMVLTQVSTFAWASCNVIFPPSTLFLKLSSDWPDRKPGRVVWTCGCGNFTLGGAETTEKNRPADQPTMKGRSGLINRIVALDFKVLQY